MHYIEYQNISAFLRSDYLEERSVENSQLFKANNIGVIYKNLENENVQKIEPEHYGRKR